MWRKSGEKMFHWAFAEQIAVTVCCKVFSVYCPYMWTEQCPTSFCNILMCNLTGINDIQTWLILGLPVKDYSYLICVDYPLYRPCLVPVRNLDTPNCGFLYSFRYFKETLITTHTGKTWLILPSMPASSGSFLGHGMGGSLCVQKYLDAQRKSKNPQNPQDFFPHSVHDSTKFRFNINFAWAV